MYASFSIKCLATSCLINNSKLYQNYGLVFKFLEEFTLGVNLKISSKNIRFLQCAGMSLGE